MSEPKFRVKQIVMILEPTGVVDGRKDSGKLTRIMRVIPEVWEFKPEGEKIQYSYEVEPGPNSIRSVFHQSWLRSLTGEEITGRI